MWEHIVLEPRYRWIILIMHFGNPESAAGSRKGKAAPVAAPPAQPLLPHLVMPDHHDVRAENVVERRLHGALTAAADRDSEDFAELLLVPGIGAQTVRALAMVAEVVHGASCRFSDPARFSLAHGGKDRHPFPVPTNVYDHTIQVMKSAVRKAKLGETGELAAVKRLDEQARRLVATATGPFGSELIETEGHNSHSYGGTRVFVWELASASECAEIAQG